MTDQDKKPFALLMGEAGAAFGRNPEKETMATYFKYLSDYQLDAVRFAVDQAIKTGERFPVIKTLREFANAYRSPVKRQVATEAVQIAEFTESEIEASKQNICNIINGLCDSTDVNRRPNA